MVKRTPSSYYTIKHPPMPYYVAALVITLGTIYLIYESPNTFLSIVWGFVVLVAIGGITEFLAVAIQSAVESLTNHRNWKD